MIGTYSISLLTQSFNVLDDTPRGSFEHLILLYHFTEDVNADELIQLVKKNNSLVPYETADGSHVYWKVVKILDVYELISEIQIDNNAEVYSRHFIDEGNLEAIIEKYFSDYVWEDSLK